MAIEPQPFGRFLLLERLATGGMAEVFLAAEEQSFGGWRFVSIKRIRPDCDDPDYREFFRTEARVALQCSHPNVPHVFEVGEVDGAPYLAMEFIRGHNLLSYLKANARLQRRATLSLATAVVASLAAALEHVHTLHTPDGRPLDVIHRDVTPQNVMISAAGTVKLIDFGIVRSAIQTHRTQAGVVKGKFSYMAPETIAHPDRVDHRADLFAVGVLMHELVSGRPLFRGRTEGETMERIRSMPIPRLADTRSDVPVEIEGLIRKSLARDPDRRFQTASELLTALEAVATHCGIPLNTVGLRNEMRALCGDPPLPVFDGTVYSFATEARVQRIASGSDSEGTQQPEMLDPAAQPRRRKRRLSSDSELAYFLDRAEVSGSFELMPDSTA